MSDDASQTNPSDNEEAAEPLTFKQKVIKELREWGVTLSVFIPLFLIFSGLVYELRVIPSESMVPNLQVGDRVTVNKFAYGYSRYSLPFSAGRYVPLPGGRIFGGKPKRGDVAVFEHPHTARVMIKRIIGIPGDEVQMRGGTIYINGERISKQRERQVMYLPHKKNSRVRADEYRETEPDGASWISHEWPDLGSEVSDTVLFKVPEGHYFFVGDNRFNSTDARAVSGHCPETTPGVIDKAGCPPRPRYTTETASVGFVPYDLLIGRADTVLFSFYRCSRAAAEPCMKKRIWRGL